MIVSGHSGKYDALPWEPHEAADEPLLAIVRRSFLSTM
jgi:hypothetical protein